MLFHCKAGGGDVIEGVGKSSWQYAQPQVHFPVGEICSLVLDIFNCPKTIHASST